MSYMTETLNRPEHPEHFSEVHHENGEALMCMGSNGECRVLVEVMPGYSPEEEQQLIASTTGALQAIDQFTGGKAADIFTGLHIKIGEDVAEGGAKAIAEENQVLLNGRKMLLSVAEMRQVSGAYSDEELAGFPDEQRPGGALEYTLVHEIGHVLDGQTKTGEAYHRVAASESPTKYGREADEWHGDNKDHEAFAEGFAHAFYGMPISETMEATVRETIDARLQEITESQANATETNRSIEPITIKSSEALLQNQNVAWHALRGYDFAGLAAVLSGGLKPAENQSDYTVSLSASPAVSQSINREANSFYAYTLQDGLSLGLDMGSAIYPRGDHGGFVDEIREPSVDAESIVAVMLPEESALKKLTDISTRHEARKPLQMEHYLKRTLEHITQLGGDISTINQDDLRLAQEAIERNEYVDSEITSRLEAQIMSCYGDIARSRGVQEPTIADVLSIVLGGNEVNVVAYSGEQKQQIGSANAKIAASKSSTGFYQSGFMRF